MYEAEITQEIDSGHKLDLPYDSKCNGWHGHRWKVVVTLRSEDLNPNGMMQDFISIKEAIKEFDHKFFLHMPDVWGMLEEPELLLASPSEKELGYFEVEEGKMVDLQIDPELQLVFKTNANGIILTGFQPTSENLARVFFEKIDNMLYGESVEVVQVELWETPSTKTVYRRDER